MSLAHVFVAITLALLLVGQGQAKTIYLRSLLKKA
jgi:hypothetical protein